MTLDDFLDLRSSRPFVWGESDCALMIADWCMVSTGCADPASHLRRRYSSALSAARHVSKAGGFVNIVDQCASLAGLDRTDDAARGDIGVVEMNRVEFAAICIAPGIWAIHSTVGIFGGAARHLAAWRVPNG